MYFYIILPSTYLPLNTPSIVSFPLLHAKLFTYLLFSYLP
jgi:hypothetical protein